MVAGSGYCGYLDGYAGNSQFLVPNHIDFSSNGILYISDSNNQVIRAFDTNTNIVSTIAGTVGLPGNLDGSLILFWIIFLKYILI